MSTTYYKLEDDGSYSTISGENIAMMTVIAGGSLDAWTTEKPTGYDAYIAEQAEIEAAYETPEQVAIRKLTARIEALGG